MFTKGRRTIIRTVTRQLGSGAGHIVLSIEERSQQVLRNVERDYSLQLLQLAFIYLLA